MERAIVKECKEYIDRNNLEGLKELYTIYMEAENAHEVSWDTVFKDVYIHACLKKRTQIINWLTCDIFPALDQLQQIALKPTFAYGRHLLRK